MTQTLAVVGKGGTGKTTFAALTIKYLVEAGLTPVLAIDADPSANLNMALGMDLGQTVGQIREDTRDQVTGGTFQPGMSKPDWFQYQVEQCVAEGDDIDLLAMGRPEGPGCYCAANHMLREAIDRIGNAYRSVVIDNEAGMEHISRQTTRDVDWLFIVSDPTQKGLAAAEHILRLVRSLGTRIDKTGLILNRVEGELPEALRARAEELDVPLLGILPQDPVVGRYDAEGRALVTLDDSSPIYSAVKTLLREHLNNSF
jgi:CO dehydrogenase maturation factor